MVPAKANVAMQRIKAPKNVVVKVCCKRKKCQFRKDCTKFAQTLRLRRFKTFAGRIAGKL
jgi:hypothetical protein